MEKEMKQGIETKSLTIEEGKARKKAKKERKRIKAAKVRELKKQRFLMGHAKDAEELLYAFKKRFRLSKKIAMQEYKAFGYQITPAQNAFMIKKEQAIKQHRALKKKAKRQRALQEEAKEYKQRIIDDFLETQVINDIETWLVLKDEFF